MDHTPDLEGDHSKHARAEKRQHGEGVSVERVGPDDQYAFRPNLIPHLRAPADRKRRSAGEEVEVVQGGTHCDDLRHAEQPFASVNGVLGDEDPEYEWDKDDGPVPADQIQDLDHRPRRLVDLRGHSSSATSAYRQQK